MVPSRRRFLLGNAAPSARIGEACLQHAGVACQACRDACAPGALRFHPAGGPPVVDPQRCDACGECLASCPTRCITLEGMVHG